MTSYPTEKGSYTKSCTVLDFRKRVFIRSDGNGLAFIWRGPSRLTSGWEVRLLIDGEATWCQCGPTLRDAVEAFRRDARNSRGALEGRAFHRELCRRTMNPR